MVNLGISPVDEGSPNWLVLYARGRQYTGLDFDDDVKNNVPVINRIAWLCSEFCNESTTLITICNLRDPSHLSRKDRVNQEEPWMPLAELESLMLKVLAKQLTIPGFELGLLYLWISGFDSRVFIAALRVDDDEDREERILPPLPRGPVVVDPPDLLPDDGTPVSVILTLTDRELVHS